MIAVSLFMSGRTLCPTCGAPMDPGTLDEVAACTWCGSRTHVQRRLRAVEPRSGGAFWPAVARADDEDRPWSHDVAAAPCPGCGTPLGTDRNEEIVQCPSCSAWSRIERRQGPDHVGSAPDYPAPRSRWRWRKRRMAQRDAVRDASIRRVLEVDDLDERLKLVLELTPWERLTADREVLLSDLMRISTTSPLLDRAVVGLVHDFLQKGDRSSAGFEGHPWRYFVLRCSRRVAFRPDASGRLVRELAYLRGGGAGLKLLLDVATYALETEQLDYAVDAFEAIEVTIRSAFNWEHVDLMNDIAAYRLLYADERLVAHLLEGVSWTWMIKPRVIARLVDDCAFERPSLVNTLANEAVSLPCARLAEYRAHLDFVDTLFTPLARGLALETKVYVPHPGMSGFPADDALRVLDFLEDVRSEPECEVVATRLLRWWADGLADHPPEGLAARIGSLRNALPTDPTWPVPKRADPYVEELSEIARRFDSGMDGRSESDREDPLPEEGNALRRRRALMDRVLAGERERRSRNIEQESKGP